MTSSEHEGQQQPQEQSPQQAGQPSQPEQPLPLSPRPEYDPMTGKRIKRQPAAPVGPIFDPMTGKRLVKKQRGPGFVLAVVALILLATGGLSAGGILWKQHRDDEKRSSAAAQKAHAEQLRADACSRELDPVYDALVAVDGRMTTGANISQFSDIVGEAASKLNAVDATVVMPNHCGMYGALSQLVAMYGAIYTAWNDCIFDYDYCDSDRDIDVSTALTDVSEDLSSIGKDMSVTEEPSDFAHSVTDIEELVAYDGR